LTKAPVLEQRPWVSGRRLQLGVVSGFGWYRDPVLKK
jgi:hypothetical protein